MTRRVEVLAEGDGDRIAEVTLENLADAQDLAASGTVEAVVIGSLTPAAAATLGAHGADRIAVITDPDGDLGEACRRTVARLEAVDPDLVLAGDTPTGHERMARLAAALGVPLATACNAVRRAGDGALEALRPVYGGRFYTRMRLPDRPALVTMQAGAGGRGLPHPERCATIEEIEPRAPAAPTPVQVCARIPADPRTVDITEAERIVAVGWGLGSREGINLAQELADRLGAALASSRPLVDAGLMPFERQVGQTGKVVSPRLYFALGISGSVFHIFGMKGSESIVAVNLDKDAPVFEIAHLKVRADLWTLLPELVKALDRGVEAS